MKSNVQSLNKMETQPIPSILLKMSLPLMLSMIFEAFYNIIDSLFIARVSENALTAISLAFPIQLLAISISVGTGVGINAALSKFLGQKEHKKANDIAINSIFLFLITYFIFFIFGVFFTRKFYSVQTNNEEILKLGVQYLSICMIFSFGSIGQITFQKILQSSGLMTLSMLSQLTGSIINIVLDPILIFGYFGLPKMGVSGAAIATVIGQIVAMIIAILLNHKKNHDIQFKVKHFKPNLQMIKEIYIVGGPAIIMQTLNSLMAFGVNNIIIGISTTAVATFGIYLKVQNFVFMPAFGINNGIIVLTAFNYGAQKKHRINQILKYGYIYSGTILILGTILFHIFAANIFNLFKASNQMLSIGIPQIRIISLSYIFVSYTLISQGFYQGLGNGVYSLIISAMRVIILLLPILYLLTKITQINNIWWAFVIAEGGAAIIATFLLKKIYRYKVAPMKN